MKKTMRKVTNSEKKRKQHVKDILAVIREFPGINVNRICEATGLQWMTVKRRLEVLEAAGDVEQDSAFRDYSFRLVAKDE